jgi:uncharacterized damage-inducible protein DinB
MSLRNQEWFKREFTFDLPVWMYPTLIERLRGTPQRLAERVGSLPRRTLVERDGGSWSIQENAGHLFDVESLWMGRVDDFFAGREALRPADLQNRQTHEANHNAASIGSILDAFGESRLALVRRIEDVDASLAERACWHPRLNKPMRLIDLALFVAEHDDHHLATITRLRRMFGDS